MGLGHVHRTTVARTVAERMGGHGSPRRRRAASTSRGSERTVRIGANMARGPGGFRPGSMRPGGPYHRVVLSPVVLALALVLFLVLLAPVGRLRRSGWSSRAAGGYLVAMLAFGLLAAELPSTARYVVPILVLAYLTPFVAARLGFERLRTAPGPTIVVERPAIEQVQGPARDIPPEDAIGTDPLSAEDRRGPASDPVAASGRPDDPASGE